MPDQRRTIGLTISPQVIPDVTVSGAGLPVNQVMGFHYQAKGRQANGLLIEKHPGGAEIEIIAAYSRDHDRKIGAGTFTTKLGAAKILYHRVPDLHPVLQQRFLANALAWLTS